MNAHRHAAIILALCIASLPQLSTAAARHNSTRSNRAAIVNNDRTSEFDDVGVKESSYVDEDEMWFAVDELLEAEYRAEDAMEDMLIYAIMESMADTNDARWWRSRSGSHTPVETIAPGSDPMLRKRPGRVRYGTSP